VSKASDVWSFGIVLWEILENKGPYPGLENIQVVKVLCDQQSHPDRPTRIQFPDELWEVMLSTWRFVPADRPTFPQLFATLHKLFNARKSFLNEDPPPPKDKLINQKHHEYFSPVIVTQDGL
jgi:serine/threonine protein kinase